MSDKDGWHIVSVPIDRASQKIQLNGWERDAAGELWMVTKKKVGDGEWTEVRRVNARNVKF